MLYCVFQTKAPFWGIKASCIEALCSFNCWGLTSLTTGEEAQTMKQHITRNSPTPNSSPSLHPSIVQHCIFSTVLSPRAAPFSIRSLPNYPSPCGRHRNAQPRLWLWIIADVFVFALRGLWSFMRSTPSHSLHTYGRFYTRRETKRNFRGLSHPRPQDWMLNDGGICNFFSYS